MSKPSTGVLSAGLLIAATVSLILAGHCYAATYYKYVDKDGTACFTDNRLSIPEEYKKKAIKITDKMEGADKKSKSAQIKAGDAVGGPFIDKTQELSSKEKIKDAMEAITKSDFFRPGVAIALFFSLFIGIGKIGRSLGHKQISSALRIALTVGVLVFLFHAHVEKAANVFNSLKKDVTDIAKHAEERNKKAEDAAKDLLEPGSPRN